VGLVALAIGSTLSYFNYLTTLTEKLGGAGVSIDTLFKSPTIRNLTILVSLKLNAGTLK